MTTLHFFQRVPPTTTLGHAHSCLRLKKIELSIITIITTCNKINVRIYKYLTKQVLDQFHDSGSKILQLIKIFCFTLEKIVKKAKFPVKCVFLSANSVFEVQFCRTYLPKITTVGENVRKYAKISYTI
jgi:hypothetical protein